MKPVKLSERTSKLALAAVTATAAIVLGVYVQSGQPTQASGVQPEQSKQFAPALDANPPLLLASASSFALPNLPQASQLEAQLPARTVALEVSLDTPTTAMPLEEPAPLLGCDISMNAIPAIAAMVNLEIKATCLPNARVTISHAGLSFTEVLDENGALGITVPAMEQDARFAVRFPNGSETNSIASVPSLEFYDRVAVQWMGEAGLQIHALEYEADYNSAGHVWYGNTRDLTSVIGGQGGFLLRLGDGQSEISQMADVYTFPTGNAATTGKVQLSVEAEVTGSNCGRDIRASTLQIHQGGPATTRQLEIAMPECAASGDFLVLKNLLQDLTIAQK